MKRSNRILVSILSVVIAAVLFLVPVSFLSECIAKASTDNSVLTADNVSFNETDDYFFTIIEDEPVALAANPFEHSVGKATYAVVGISLVVLLGAAYISWYLMVRRNISNYSSVLTDQEIRSLIPSKPFIHPLELSAAEYEVQYRAARKYVG